MEIGFAGGAVYRCFAVPAAVHAALMDASSKGVFFDLHVRAKYGLGPHPMVMSGATLATGI